MALLAAGAFSVAAGVVSVAALHLAARVWGETEEEEQARIRMERERISRANARGRRKWERRERLRTCGAADALRVCHRRRKKVRDWLAGRRRDNAQPWRLGDDAVFTAERPGADNPGAPFEDRTYAQRSAHDKMVLERLAGVGELDIVVKAGWESHVERGDTEYYNEEIPEHERPTLFVAIIDDDVPYDGQARVALTIADRSGKHIALRATRDVDDDETKEDWLGDYFDDYKACWKLGPEPTFKGDHSARTWGTFLVDHAQAWPWVQHGADNTKYVSLHVITEADNGSFDMSDEGQEPSRVLHGARVGDVVIGIHNPIASAGPYGRHYDHHLYLARAVDPEVAWRRAFERVRDSAFVRARLGAWVARAKEHLYAPGGAMAAALAARFHESAAARSGAAVKRKAPEKAGSGTGAKRARK